MKKNPNLGTAGPITLNPQNIFEVLSNAKRLLDEQPRYGNLQSFTLYQSDLRIETDSSYIMKWAAKNCRWHWVFGIYPAPDSFCRELVVIFRKFTSIPKEGELITRKHFKGFWMTIKPPIITWKKFEFGNIRYGEMTRAPGLGIQLIIPIKFSFRDTWRIW